MKTISDLLLYNLLDYKCNPKALAIGNRIVVVTQLGQPVSIGLVKRVFTNTGYVQVELEAEGNESVVHQMYDFSLYSFVRIADLGQVEEETLDEDDLNSLSESSEEEAEPTKPVEADKPKSRKLVNKKSLDDKKKMTTIAEDDIDMVLSEVSTALIKGLKTVGVKEVDIYPLVVKAHEAINQLLRTN